jgi:O-antigen ligase
VLGLLAIRRWGPMLLGFGGLVVVVVGSLASLTVAQLRVGYFSSVGKTDNTATREVLWRAGAERFLDSPIVGDSFTRDIAVPSTVTGASRLVPVHNDYLQLAMSGGILGTALFLAWCLATIVVGIRLVRGLRERGLTEQAALALVVTAGIVSMLATALFNPVLIDARSSLLLGLLHYILASLRLTAPGRSCPAGAGAAITGMRR